MGVQLFFIVSGFVILLSAQGRTVGQFVASRVARLYPAYWVAVLATGLLTWVAVDVFKPASPTKILVNLTMMQEALGVGHVDGVYWTLWVELLFYIMGACLIAIGMNERRLMAFIVLWPIAAGMAATAENTLLVDLLSPRYAALFCGGMAIFLIHRYGHSLLRWLLVAYCVAIATQQTVDLFVMGTMQRVTGLELSPSVATIVVLSLFGLVIAVTLSPLKYLGWRWMSVAGALTYPVYLIHENWGWAIIQTLAPHLNKWVVLAVALTFTLVVAWAIERWVERPGRRLLRPALERVLTPHPPDPGRPGRRRPTADEAPRDGGPGDTRGADDHAPAASPGRVSSVSG
ncbi:acyltransferase [Tessaracoccus sp. HDW20]|nr:acyltransferase [Tessaracoccus coleopterorum]